MGRLMRSEKKKEKKVLDVFIVNNSLYKITDYSSCIN